MLRFICAVTLASALVVASRPATMTTLIVSVSDAKTGSSIAGAEVLLSSLRRTARTESNGEARFTDVTPGKYRVQVRALGYTPGESDVDVTRESATVRVRLERATSLDTVRVVNQKTERRIELRLAEFESRRQMGIGRFLTDSALREERSQSVQSVLATRFPGIQMRDRSIEAMQASGFVGDMHCPILIYVDGHKVTDVSRDKERLGPESQRLAPPANPKGTMVPQPETPRRELFPLDNLRPDSLVGVEVYSQSTAPVQYRPIGTYCKVVLLWTRR
jgi:hypothetical protein